MNNETTFAVFGLKDFDFGISTGWAISGDKKLVRRFETSSFKAEAKAVPAHIRYKHAKTTIRFEIDQILPEMIGAQTMMEKAGWPSRKNDPHLYAAWNKARSAQAEIFKGIVKQLQQESPEFATVLDGGGGWLSARGTQDPQLWREPLIIPVGMFNKVLPTWVHTITIHKRAKELDRGNLMESTTTQNSQTPR